MSPSPTERRGTNAGCRGLCDTTELHGRGWGFHMSRDGKKVSLYQEGYVFCRRCSKFMKKHNRYFCICCGKRVSTKPANTKKYYDAGIMTVARY